jgi:ketosteroid isomerase-like protein
MRPQDLLEEYLIRTNSHDASSLRSLIAPDASYFFTEGSFFGRDEISAALEATWQRIQDERYSIEDARWPILEPGVAVCTYRFRWHGRVEGVAQSGFGLGTTVLRLVDGQWFIAHEHLHAVDGVPG